MLIRKLETGTGILYNIDTVADADLLVSLGFVVLDLELAQTAINDAEEAAETALMQVDYNGTSVSITAEDGNALLQITNAFARGETETYFHFANGTIMHFVAAEADFETFSDWFVAQRNALFGAS